MLMWTLIVDLWIVPVYNEHTGVADCFNQLENTLIALENLFEFLWVTINLNSSYAGYQLTSFAILISPMTTLATGLSYSLLDSNGRTVNAHSLPKQRRQC